MILKDGKVTPVGAIREFFQRDGGRAITTAEMQALSRDERVELGQLCAAELGVPLDLTSTPVAAATK